MIKHHDGVPIVYDGLDCWFYSSILVRSIITLVDLTMGQEGISQNAVSSVERDVQPESVEAKKGKLSNLVKATMLALSITGASAARAESANVLESCTMAAVDDLVQTIEDQKDNAIDAMVERETNYEESGHFSVQDEAKVEAAFGPFDITHDQIKATLGDCEELLGHMEDLQYRWDDVDLGVLQAGEVGETVEGLRPKQNLKVIYQHSSSL